jgi:hypothetical protein
VILILHPARGHWWCPEANGAPSSTGARRGLASEEGDSSVAAV